MTPKADDMPENSSQTTKSREQGSESQSGLPATKARQGRLGQRVLLVLAVALLLAAFAWWVAEIYGVAIEPDNPLANTPPPTTRQNPSP